MKLFIMFVIALILCLALSLRSVCYADTTEDLMHITAHFGGTYVMTHATEVICVKVAGKANKLSCTIIGAILANGVNVAYKARQNFPADTKRALVSGAAGTMTAGLLITLDW